MLKTCESLLAAQMAANAAWATLLVRRAREAYAATIGRVREVCWLRAPSASGVRGCGRRRRAARQRGERV
jgi:hypothetical protein